MNGRDHPLPDGPIQSLARNCEERMHKVARSPQIRCRSNGEDGRHRSYRQSPRLTVASTCSTLPSSTPRMHFRDGREHNQKQLGEEQRNDKSNRQPELGGVTRWCRKKWKSLHHPTNEDD